MRQTEQTNKHREVDIDRMAELDYTFLSQALKKTVLKPLYGTMCMRMATRVMPIKLLLADFLSGGVRVWFQAAKVQSFSGFLVGNPTNKATASKLF